MNKIFNDKNKEALILSVSLLLPLLILTLFFVTKPQTKDLPENELVFEKEYQFDPKIKASSAMVTELKTGKILYAKNENEKKPIASLTKLFTVLVANEYLEKQKTNTITINEQHLKTFGDSGLKVGQLWKVKDLIDYALISSSNDSANALALSTFDGNFGAFVGEMNNISRKLGLANTFFSNPTGLDNNSQTNVGAISTAKDITKLLRYITLNKLDLYNESRLEQKNVTYDEKIYEMKNTNKSIYKLTGVLLSKTGYTNLAGGNLLVVADFGLNNPISVVVLGSTVEDRENDVISLMEETKKYYAYSLE